MDLPNLKLGTLATWASIKQQKAHSAVVDVLVLQTVFLKPAGRRYRPGYRSRCPATPPPPPVPGGVAFGDQPGHRVMGTAGQLGGGARRPGQIERF